MANDLKTGVAFQFGKSKVISLREHVYHEIRNAIIKGKLAPDSRLFEVDISEQLGVSRGPVREAFRILEQEGLVISHPHRETVVVNIPEEETSQILVPSRLSFELYAVEKAAKLFQESDFARFEEIITRMQDAADQNNLEYIIELDVQFHSLLVELTVSPGMFRVWTSILGKIHSRMLNQGYQVSNLQDIVAEHVELVALIRSADFPKIKEHLHKHIC